ncbi:hypothetical protein GQ600_13480 [Phytophthora cactorum]|nr:hypothetical protein GQ600_13480 [Phytophthora cactorum]
MGQSGAVNIATGYSNVADSGKLQQEIVLVLGDVQLRVGLVPKPEVRFRKSGGSSISSSGNIIIATEISGPAGVPGPAAATVGDVTVSTGGSTGGNGGSVFVECGHGKVVVLAGPFRYGRATPTSVTGTPTGTVGGSISLSGGSGVDTGGSISLQSGTGLKSSSGDISLTTPDAAVTSGVAAVYV